MDECRRKHSENMMIKTESVHSNFHSDVVSKEEKLILINYGMHMSVWKICTCSQACMSQKTVRGELFNNFRWSGMKFIDHHGPETHDGNSRCPMMGFT